MARRDTFIDSLHEDLNRLAEARPRFSATREFAQKLCKVLNYLNDEVVYLRGHKEVYTALILGLITLVVALSDKIADLV